MFGQWLRLFGLLALFGAASPAAAQTTDAPNGPPPKVQELLQLLDDPAVRDWVAQQKAPAEAQPAPTDTGDMMAPSSYMDRRLAEIRKHISDLVLTVPNMPAEFARARDILMVEF